MQHKGTMDKKEETKRLSHEVLGTAIEVHKVLGPGLLESAYEECLAHEFLLRGFQFTLQEVQLLTYLRLSGHWLGLLLNFNSCRLQEGIRRLVN